MSTDNEMQTYSRLMGLFKSSLERYANKYNETRYQIQMIDITKSDIDQAQMIITELNAMKELYVDLVEDVMIKHQHVMAHSCYTFSPEFNDVALFSGRITSISEVIKRLSCPVTLVEALGTSINAADIRTIETALKAHHELARLIKRYRSLPQEINTLLECLANEYSTLVQRLEAAANLPGNVQSCYRLTLTSAIPRVENQMKPKPHVTLNSGKFGE